MVSFARPQQLELVSEVSRSFALDNGAYSAWRSGQPLRDWQPYYGWVEKWKNHPACDFAVIPDVIGGSEEENDDLVAEWPFHDCGMPVFHLHESDRRLERLIKSFSRVALGSSGIYKNPGSLVWWLRMTEIMQVVCDEDDRPVVKLHGLRMLAPAILSIVPLSSADSTNVARNVNLDRKWKGTYQPSTKLGRALTLCDRIESIATPSRWCGPDGPESEDASHCFRSLPQLKLFP